MEKGIWRLLFMVGIMLPMLQSCHHGCGVGMGCGHGLLTLLVWLLMIVFIIAMVKLYGKGRKK